MRRILVLGLCGGLLVQAAWAQSLADLARQERERKAKQKQPASVVTNETVRKAGDVLKPPFDLARKGDLDYLLDQVQQTRVPSEVFVALVPLKERAVPRLLPLLEAPEGQRRLSPAAALIVLGNSAGLAAAAKLLPTPEELKQKTSANPAAEAGSAEFRQAVERTLEATQAVQLTNFGLWRFIDGTNLAPEPLVQRMQASNTDLSAAPDRGQRIFTAALRHSDPSVRLGAISMIKVMAEGEDFGFQVERSEAQNRGALQEIVTFLATRQVRPRTTAAPKPK